MPRITILLYTLAALWLTGFAAAALTAGATGAVACGALGLLGFLATTAIRIDAQQPHTRRAPRTRHGKAAR